MFFIEIDVIIGAFFQYVVLILITTAKNAVFNYAAGDGNDTIWSFNETSLLSITGGKYSAEEDGKNIIVNVGENSITLYYTSGRTININGKTYTLKDNKLK